MIVKPKSKWRYVGGSEGFDLIHTVVQVRGVQITTWSDFDQGKDDENGYTWLGIKDDFLELFKPVDPQKQEA